MSNIEQVTHDRQLTEQGRHEGMQWMRDHLIEKLNHDLVDNECDCQCDALKDVINYLTGELPESTHQHVWQTDNLSDTYETICGVCQAVKEDN